MSNRLQKISSILVIFLLITACANNAGQENPKSALTGFYKMNLPPSLQGVHAWSNGPVVIGRDNQRFGVVQEVRVNARRALEGAINGLYTEAQPLVGSVSQCSMIAASVSNDRVVMPSSAVFSRDSSDSEIGATLRSSQRAVCVKTFDGPAYRIDTQSL